MNEALAVLFPLAGVAAVGLTALFVVKPWQKRHKPTIISDNATVTEKYQAILDAFPDAINERLVLSPQAKHRLHEELAQDAVLVDHLLKRIHAREGRLQSTGEQFQTSNGGN